MATKPRIRTMEYAEMFPEKVAVFKDGKAWWVFRGEYEIEWFGGRNSFRDALAYALREA